MIPMIPIVDFIERSMIQMLENLYIHAKKRGATDEWLDEVRSLPNDSLQYDVLVLCYGDPTEKKDK